MDPVDILVSYLIQEMQIQDEADGSVVVLYMCGRGRRREGRGVGCRSRGIGGSNDKDMTECLAMNAWMLCNFVSFRFSFEKKNFMQL